MYSTALSYLNNETYLTQANFTGLCVGRTKPRGYFGTVGTIHKSVPYDWGGYQTVSEFNSFMAQGYLAGDIDTVNPTASWGTETCSYGVDCSGFLSRVWGTGHRTTVDLPDIAIEIGKSQLQRGDIINRKKDHVAMFDRIDSDGKLWTLEATKYNSYDRVVSIRNDSWARFNGYSYYRYNNVCSDTKTMTSLSITGPLSVNESSSASYEAIVKWNDNSTTTVSPSWSESSSYATITSNGVLKADSVSADKTVTVSATYTSGGVTKTAVKDVTIVNGGKKLTSLSITGPSSINENSSARYEAIAKWSDNSTSTVTPNWSEDSSYTTISSNGLLNAESVSSKKTVAVKASYSIGDVTKTARKDVTIVDVGKTLKSLSINGPSSVNENSSASYEAIVKWSDNSTSTVTPNWSEDSSYATISSGGLLKVTSVSSKKTVTVRATYSFGDVTKKATKDVTIADVGKTLKSLSINGPSSVNENSSATYEAIAKWSDNSTSTVMPNWSEDSSYTTISSSGVLKAKSVSSKKTVTVKATYSFGDVTKKDTKDVKIIDR
jgi:hypothetical protein